MRSKNKVLKRLGNFKIKSHLKKSPSYFFIIRVFIDAFIDLKKPIVVCINGPAVGLGVSVLGLVDLAFCR